MLLWNLFLHFFLYLLNSLLVNTVQLSIQTAHLAAQELVLLFQALYLLFLLNKFLAYDIHRVLNMEGRGSFLFPELLPPGHGVEHFLWLFCSLRLILALYKLDALVHELYVGNSLLLLLSLFVILFTVLLFSLRFGVHFCYLLKIFELWDSVFLNVFLWWFLFPLYFSN